jgi:hypothetical protein
MNDGADFVRTAGEIEGERVLIECLSGCIKGKSWKEKVGRIEKCAGEENYRERACEKDFCNGVVGNFGLGSVAQELL